MAKTGWVRSLGTSKREQGIVTPKAPQNRPKRKPLFIQAPLSLWERALRFFMFWKDNKIKVTNRSFVKQAKAPKVLGRHISKPMQTIHRIQSK